MSTVLGVFSSTQKPIPAQWLTAMIDASEPWPYDRKGISTESSCVFACLQQFNTPQAQLVEQPYGNSVQIVFDGRLDNRESLAKQLQISLSPQTTDEQLILAAFIKYQTSLGDHLLGDFVIAVYDKNQHELFLIRDHMGVRPLFISQHQDYFAFASNKNALLTLPWLDKSINQQWLADYLTITKVDHHTTFYQAIETLPAAHWVQLKQGKKNKQKYWQLDPNAELHYDSDEEYTAQFKALLSQAIECRLRSYSDVASELSGGLDSTSITAMASRLLHKQHKPLHALSHVLPPENEGKIFPYKDEKRYIAALLKTLKNVQHSPIYSRDRGIVEILEYAQKIHAGPERNDLTTVGDELFQILKDGNIRTLLSGFGGDQLVTSQGVGWIDEVSKQSLLSAWQQLGDYVPNPYRKIRFFLSLLKRRATRHQHQALTGAQSQWDERLLETGIQPEFAQAFGYPQRYFDHPLRPHKVNSVRDREFLVIHSPHVVYRLEDSALGAASHGVDYRYPLLDIRLLQFCLSLPTKQKIRKGMRRRMIRMATQGILPDEIRLRHDKSRATVPTVTQRFLKDSVRLQELIKTLKQNKQANQYIHPAIMDKLINILAHHPEKNLMSKKSFLRLLGLALWLKS